MIYLIYIYFKIKRGTLKNYYDELQISRTASKEVIEKVYKLLAKKYHPDTTSELNKHAAEEKFKIISEAYEVLSNDERRKKYDLQLQQSNPTISYDEYIRVVKQRDYFKSCLNKLQNNSTTSTNATHQYYTPNNNYYNTTNINNNNLKREPYYNQNTENSTQTFSYYIQRLKEFFSNIGLFFFSLILALLIINFIF